MLAALLTPFINYVLQDPALRYLSAANMSLRSTAMCCADAYGRIRHARPVWSDESDSRADRHNGVHDSTGGQATVSAHLSFAGVAAACGYALACEGDDIGMLDALFGATALAGPRFACVKTRAGTPDGLPRPSITPRT
jgi:hypothetical protein